MTKFEVTLEGRLVVSPEYDGEDYDRDSVVDKCLNGIMRELLRLDRVADPHVTGSISTGEMVVKILVDAESYTTRNEEIGPFCGEHSDELVKRLNAEPQKLIDVLGQDR